MTAHPIRPVIVAKPYTGGLPVGTLVSYVGPDRDHLITPDGQALSRDDYPELAQAIGDTYCPPRLRRQDRWSRLLRWAFIADPTMPNPAYDPDTFRVPDLRGQWNR